MKKKCMAAVLLLLLLLSGCGKEKAETLTVFAMDTVMQMTVYGDQAAEAIAVAEQEIYRLDRMFSLANADSELSAINAAAGKETVTVSEETAYLLQRSRELTEETGGAFDLTIAPLVQTWGFLSEDPHVPEQEEIDAALSLIDAAAVWQENTSVYLEKEGMAVDFAGIAKGYLGDHLANVLREQGIDCAMLALGGNVRAVGTKTDGSAWRVAVQDPQNAERGIGILDVIDCSVITSGGYQRYFEENGQVYQHILDPATGYPVTNDLLSVTIISEDGTRADALSTALFVMGKEKAIDFWQEKQDFEFIIVTVDNEVLVSEGLQEGFTPTGEENGYIYQTIMAE